MTRSKHQKSNNDPVIYLSVVVHLVQKLFNSCMKSNRLINTISVTTLLSLNIKSTQMNQDFAICIQFSKENLRKTIDLCYNIDVSRALLASEQEVFLFFLFLLLPRSTMFSNQSRLERDLSLPRWRCSSSQIKHLSCPSRHFSPLFSFEDISPL